VLNARFQSSGVGRVNGVAKLFFPRKWGGRESRWTRADLGGRGIGGLSELLDYIIRDGLFVCSMCTSMLIRKGNKNPGTG
jgi:hypothetical protein